MQKPACWQTDMTCQEIVLGPYIDLKTNVELFTCFRTNSLLKVTKILKICLFEQILLLSFQDNVFKVQMSVFLVYLQLLFFLFFFWVRVSLCSPDWSAVVHNYSSPQSRIPGLKLSFCLSLLSNLEFLPLSSLKNLIYIFRNCPCLKKLCLEIIMKKWKNHL